MVSCRRELFDSRWHVHYTWTALHRPLALSQARRCIDCLANCIGGIKACFSLKQTQNRSSNIYTLALGIASSTTKQTTAPRTRLPWPLPLRRISRCSTLPIGHLHQHRALYQIRGPEACQLTLGQQCIGPYRAKPLRKAQTGSSAPPLDFASRATGDNIVPITTHPVTSPMTHQ